MGSVHSRSVLSASMNMVITIFGFVLSAIFMFIICCRLLCFRLRRGNNLEIAHAARRSSPVNQAWQGLDPSIVKVFPTIKFNQQIFVSSEDNLCTICLGDYKEKEALRFLPRCGHAFHVACIDMWLGQHSTCPICRISLRTFPEWRHFSCPLISYSAKPRFVPGALPDTMFERPSGFHIAPKSALSGLSKDSLVYGASNKTVIPGSGISTGYLNASTSMTVENNVVSEAAESSISRWQRRGEIQIVEESSRDSEGPSISSHCVLSERLMHLALPRTHSNGDNSGGECRTPNIGELHIRLQP